MTEEKQFLTEMWRCDLIIPRRQHKIRLRLTDIDQHIRIREPLHRAYLSTLRGGQSTMQRLATKVLFRHLLIRHRCHAVVIELEPARLPVGLDVRKVVTAVQVTRVDEDAYEFVYPRFRPVCGLV
jgi:hypothetical protein